MLMLLFSSIFKDFEQILARIYNYFSPIVQKA